MEKLTIDDCRMIAARIWCDAAYEHIVMNAQLCEEIAQKLFKEAQKQEQEKNDPEWKLVQSSP